ncbi:MAG: sigma-70 family RNA polymerase sigma factor [Armatimonadota bacterium]|nr:sigma-70 family RNA polymerase sigma factor [Armatimonadota bacterium]MDR7440378.1 sigma-70 family RNA polymerase sigma factor [Armatimonadota bacterium]MDR7444613.1 sigma-70 family RNA polymerase sigma factor [Armatimonadota bacterium]MDR7569439.1 sigma-70 family RNA polymerase sigma factor [Armatimonadota bacterium]MDR7613678.1 sigma-70 family RNA polymerase sigma factor [Armatimonadota bacterium]
MDREGGREAFERYRRGEAEPDALLACLQEEGRHWLAVHFPNLPEADREDLLQQALVAAFYALPRLRGDSYDHLRSYFLTTLRSKVTDHHRRRYREVVGLPGASDGPAELQQELPAQEPSGFEEVELLIDLARVLSPEEYRVARLKMEGFSDRDIARILRKAPGTVAALWHRSRRKIQGFGT